MERTSLTHPLRIDAVETPGGGRIGLTVCPGKKQPNAASGAWNRDLDLDLRAIRTWGAQALVSLIEPDEYAALGVADLPERARALLTHYALPIPDYGLPDAKWEERWRAEGPRIRAVLLQGGRVCLHCMGGLGRSGLVAARLLVELGKTPDEAIAAVRAARPGAVETREQEEYVRTCAAAHGRQIGTGGD